MRWIVGAVGVALIWAAVWAAAGALIGIADPSRRTEELWLGPPIGYFPGFVAGVVFSVLLAMVARGCRLAELSIYTTTACGALAGMLVGALPFAINEPRSEAPLWLIAATVIGSTALLGAVSAAVSAALARVTSRVHRTRPA